MTTPENPADRQPLKFPPPGTMLSPEAKARILAGFRDLVCQGLVRPSGGEEPAQESLDAAESES